MDYSSDYYIYCYYAQCISILFSFELFLRVLRCLYISRCLLSIFPEFSTMSPTPNRKDIFITANQKLVLVNGETGESSYALANGVVYSHGVICFCVSEYGDLALVDQTFKLRFFRQVNHSSFKPKSLLNFYSAQKQIKAMCFSKDSEFLIALNYSNEVMVINVRTMKILAKKRFPFGNCISLVF